MNKKSIFFSVFVFVFVLLGCLSAADLQVGTLQRRFKLGMTCTLSINNISPRTINTGQRFTASYNLKCRLAMDIPTLEAKVGLFINNRLRETQELRKCPNNEERRYFISAYAPANPDTYPLLLKVVPIDADLETASGSTILASVSSEIHVGRGLPDLVITSFTISNPEKRTRDRRDFLYFPFSIQIRNSGAAAADPFAIGITDDTEEFSRFRLVSGGHTDAPLPAGRIINLSGEAELPFTDSEITSTYRLRAKADIPVGEFVGPEGAVEESDENNNFSRTVTVRSSFASINGIVGGDHAYRGSEIELVGSFGESLGDRKVAIFRGGVRKAYAEVLRFSSSKIRMRIPNDNTISRETTHQILLVEGVDQGVSNAVDVYVCRPIRVTGFEVHGSGIHDYLVNDVNAKIYLDADPRCRRIALSFRNADALSEEIIQDVRGNSVIFVPNARIPAASNFANCAGLIRDVCTDVFDDSEGTDPFPVRVFKLHDERIDRVAISFLIPCARLHFDSKRSYLQLSEMCNPAISGGDFHDLDILSSYNIPKTGCDYKVWFRDINCDFYPSRMVEIGSRKITLKFPFETGGPHEIGLDYSSCSGNVPDINLLRLYVEMDISFSASNGVMNPGTFFRSGIPRIDLDADVNKLADGFVELFTGDIDPMIKRILREEVTKVMGSNNFKTQMHDLFLSGFKSRYGENTKIMNVSIEGDVILIEYVIF